MRDTGWRDRLRARSQEDPPVLEPTREQLQAVIDRHGLDTSLEEIIRLQSIGTVNQALALGEAYVLRIPKVGGVGDTLTESVAAPVATAAGLKTPALLVFDDSTEIFDVPYTIYERVDGENFGLSDLEPTASAEVYREIGRQLAWLHQEVTECADPQGYLDEPGRPDPGDLLEHMGREMLLSRYNVGWLQRVFARLRPAVEAATGFRRFLHNDVLPTNVMVKGERFAALIDWNDSGWGDPALEFAALPSRAVPFALEGYREVAPMDGDDTAEHRILWDHLCQALEFMICPVDMENISWARPPYARMTELVAAAARLEAWRGLLE